MTKSIQKFLAVSEYRRKRQLAYNEEHHITPRSVIRAVEQSLSTRPKADKAMAIINDAGGNFDLTETVREIEADMLAAANNLEFEKAALLRDQIRELKRSLGPDSPAPPARPASYRKTRQRRSSSPF
jgi:excinuclease ABC subunit B